MKICFLTTDFPPTLGGVASHAYELARALVLLGHEVTVLTSRVPGTAGEEMLAGIRVLRPRMPWQRPFYNMWLRHALRSHLKAHPTDIVHVHGMRPLESTRGLTVPVVFTNHTSGFLKRLEKPARVYRRLLSRIRHVALVLAPSEELCEATRTIGYPGPVRFVSNGVDTDRFYPREAPARSEPVLLLARRLVEKNGVLVFAEAIVAMRQQGFKVLIAGDGDQRPAMQAIFEGAGIADRVTFLGGVPNTEMPAIYAAADVSVLPSFYEATSITGLESMACGKPVVGTRVGGIPFLIEEGVSGLLVPPGAPEAMAETLDAIVADPVRRKSMSRAARERAVARFDWRVIATETVAAYQDILSGGSQ